VTHNDHLEYAVILRRVLMTSPAGQLLLGRSHRDRMKKAVVWEVLESYALAFRRLGFSWDDVTEVFNEALSASWDTATVYRQYRHKDTAFLQARSSAVDIEKALCLAAPTSSGSGVK